MRNIGVRPVTIPAKVRVCQLEEVDPVKPVLLDPVTPIGKQRKMAYASSKPAENFLELFDWEQSQLTEKQHEQLKATLVKHKSVFSTGDMDYGRTNLTKHEIKLTDDIPFKERYRRVPPALVEEVREHLNMMASAGITRPSFSSWSSPVVLVRKKDGGLRFCVDFRTLNRKTVKDRYTLPRVDDMLDCVAGAKYFSKLDLKSGYWQIELEEKDKAKTAFNVGPGYGFWEFNVMAFGLTNAPSTFQRLMERTLSDLNLRECLVFIDDILIFSATFEEHIERLGKVFDKLAAAGLKLKPSKCEFLKESVIYLGHKLSSTGIEPGLGKLEAVNDWPEPTTVADVRKWLGFSGYFRRFIRDYAKKARPMTDLLTGISNRKGAKKVAEKRMKVTWGPKEQASFNDIKQALLTAPVLGFADYEKPFELHTDASHQGLGAVLCQNDDEGKRRVIAYASRGVSKSERNYPTHKLEFLALKWAVSEKFHDYLYGNHCLVKTDNNPLTYVLKSARLDATGHRWLHALSTYNLELEYASGMKMGDADGLSRSPLNKLTADVFAAICQVRAPRTPGLTMSEVMKMKPLQNDDEEIQRILQTINRKEKFAPTSVRDLKISKIFKALVIKQGLLGRMVETKDGLSEFRVWLPTSERTKVMRCFHDRMGHVGRDKVVEMVKARCFWPGMKSDIEEYLKSCKRCVVHKFPTPVNIAPLNLRFH